MEKKGTKNGAHEKKSQVLAIAREGLLTVVIPVIMLMPGIIFDSVYSGKWKIKLVSDMINSLKLLSGIGITYHSAFQILNSNVGVLMTMVSLFLTMNINAAERSEKIIYGITRKELYDQKKNRVHRWTKRIGYFTPLLMVVFLNLSYCTSGYLLFFYNYVFLIIHYYRHVSSYSDEVTRKALIKKLTGYLPGIEKGDEAGILECKMFLENVGRSIEKDGRWFDASELFQRLIEAVEDIDSQGRAALCCYFYQIVYWKRRQRNEAVSMEVLKTCIENLDRKSAKEDVHDRDWAIVEGMLGIVLSECGDNELAAFFRWFLNQAQRSRAVYEKIGKALPVEVFKNQVGIVLVLLEYRLRKKGIEEERLQEQIRSFWDIGKSTSLTGDFRLKSDIEMLNSYLEEEREYCIREILDDLRSDYTKNTKRTILANLIAM